VNCRWPLASRLLAAVGAAALLAGCSFGKDEDACVSEEEYQEAQVAPDITVPPGLDKPASTGRLNVPPGPAEGEALAKTAGCLQQPPSYFDKPLKETRN
jgi:uncharacterized lipoprotein